MEPVFEKVTIKKGGVEIILNRNMLANAIEASDGIVFQFKDGSFFHVIDTNMNPGIKAIVVNTVNHFNKGNIKINFDDVRKPVLIEN